MDLDKALLDWLLKSGWFDPPTLQRISAQRPSYDKANLVERLHAMGMLTQEQAQFALREVQRQSGSTRLSPTIRESAGQILSRALSGFGFDERILGLEFAGYTIQGEISRGAMGVVLKVSHDDYDRPLAMKVLHCQYHDEVISKRFLREATVLKHCDHPNIVKVYDFNVVDNMPFYVMEFIEGQSLEMILNDEIKRHGAVPDFAWTASVFEGVADALAYCHENGLVHRDVKPGNIIVERQSLRPILVDFGIVRRRSESKIGEGSRFETSTKLTKTGEVHGTPAYMSPEQMESEQFGQVSEKSDVWGFGATLFHALTGIAPYEREGANIYLALVQKNPPRVQKMNPEAPYWLDLICHRCLQRVSGTRPDMSSVLDDLLSPNRVPKKNLSPYVLAFVFLVFVSTGAGIWFYLKSQHEQLTRDHNQAHKAARDSYDQLNKEFKALVGELDAATEQRAAALIESIPKLEALQIRDESLAKRLEETEHGDDRGVIKELQRSLRAFQLVLQFRKGVLDPHAESSEKQVRLIKNESPKSNDFVQWAHALRLKKAEKWDDALQAFLKIKESPELGAYALGELAELHFQLKNWKEADRLVELVLESKSSKEKRLKLILRRAIIQIRLKNRAVARVFLKSALKEPVTDPEDRENALRLALFLGEVECFSQFLEGSSEQDKRRPYAAIASVWNELELGRRGEARHRLTFLPTKHSKRFLRAHSWLAKALVQREFFELNDSSLSIEQARELNKQSQNTLIQLYCARVAISNLMVGDELATAMDALAELENSLPEDLDDIQTGLLADINLRVGDVARFNYLLDISEVGRNYMSYYKRALKLSRDPEILIRMALIAVLKGQKDEADKRIKQLSVTERESLNGILLQAHYDWPNDRSSAKDPALQRSLENFAKCRELLRPRSLQRLQRDFECRVSLSLGKEEDLDTVLLQKYLNRCSEYNALDPRTAHLAWRLSSNLSFPGAAVSSRRLSYHLDPAFSENWETYALMKNSTKNPNLDWVIAFDRERNRSRLNHETSLFVLAYSLNGHRQKDRALYYSRILFERAPSFLSNLRLLKSLLDDREDQFELTKVNRAMNDLKKRGEQPLKEALQAYEKGQTGETIALCKRSIGYLSTEQHRLRDKLYGHSLLQESSSVTNLKAFHILARAALTDLDATILLFNPSYSYGSASKHRDLATERFSYPKNSPIDERASELRQVFHQFVSYLGRSGKPETIQPLLDKVQRLLHSHPASTGLRLVEACLLFSQGYAHDALLSLELVLTRAKTLAPQPKCFVYLLASMFHKEAGQLKEAKQFAARVRNFQSNDAKLKGRSLFLERLAASFPQRK